jgi:hypothetical protein
VTVLLVLAVPPGLGHVVGDVGSGLLVVCDLANVCDGGVVVVAEVVVEDGALALGKGGLGVVSVVERWGVCGDGHDGVEGGWVGWVSPVGGCAWSVRLSRRQGGCV